VEWNIVEDTEDSTIESSFESGYIQTRPRFTINRKMWSDIAYKYLTVDDKALLRNFMDEVNMSSLPFNWLNPDDDLTYVVRFKPIPRIVYVATGNYYQATMGFIEIGGATMLPTVSETKNIIAAESLVAGNFVNIYKDGSILKIRKSNSVSGYSADGFILSNALLGESIKVHFLGKINNALSGLTSGTVYYLSTSGNVTATAPTDGSTIQRVGGALSATELLFQPGDPI
jgi:hypothetical protein